MMKTVTMTRKTTMMKSVTMMNKNEEMINYDNPCLFEALRSLRFRLSTTFSFWRPRELGDRHFGPEDPAPGQHPPVVIQKKYQ